MKKYSQVIAEMRKLNKAEQIFVTRWQDERREWDVVSIGNLEARYTEREQPAFNRALKSLETKGVISFDGEGYIMLKHSFRDDKVEM